MDIEKEMVKISKIPPKNVLQFRKSEEYVREIYLDDQRIGVIEKDHENELYECKLGQGVRFEYHHMQSYGSEWPSLRLMLRLLREDKEGIIEHVSRSGFELDDENLDPRSPDRKINFKKLLAHLKSKPRTKLFAEFLDTYVSMQNQTYWGPIIPEDNVISRYKFEKIFTETMKNMKSDIEYEIVNYIAKNPIPRKKIQKA